MIRRSISKDDQFGDLIVIDTIIENTYNSDHPRTYGVCLCKCGNITKILAKYLLDGNKESCGCDYNRQTGKYNKTGLSKDKLYRVWYSMIRRCSNEKDYAYKYYGEKGISVCYEWVNSYISFKKWAILNGYKSGLTIDRIDVNGNYCEENCRWVSRSIQNNNLSTNIKIDCFNETKTLTGWSEDKRCIVNRKCLEGRIKRGWEPEKAITEPKKRTGQYGIR